MKGKDVFCLIIT